VLQIFRNNDFVTNLLALGYLAIFAANTWLYPTEQLDVLTSLPASLWGYVLPYVSDPLTNKVCFVLLVLLQAFYVNYLVGEYKLLRQQTLVTAICFMLLYFAYFDTDFCSPLLLANTFLIASLHSLLASYDKKVSLGTIFNIGFWIAIAAFCYHSYWVFILWAMIGLLIVRTFDWQEFILLLLGFVVPFFLMGTWHYVLGSYDQWISTQLGVHFGSTQFNIDVNGWFYLMLAVLFLPYILSLLNLGGIQFKTTTREKKFIQVILLLPIIGLLSFFFQQEIHLIHFQLFIVPLGILLGLVTQSYKTALFAEAVHFLLFMICLGMQYQAFFFAS